MKKETVRALTIIVGLVILLVVLGLGSAVYLFTQSVDVGKADAATADEEFTRVRGRFAGIAPVLEVRDRRPVLTRKPPADGPRTRLSTMHILHWDPEDASLSRIDVPFWLIRLKSGPIEIASDQTSFSDRDLGITVEDLERFGPTLLMDHAHGEGERLLIWTE